jgi:hypothetical protein
MREAARGVLGVVAGAGVAIGVVSFCDFVVSRLWPLPAGVNVHDATQLGDALRDFPVAAFVALLAGWVLAAAAGA